MEDEGQLEINTKAGAWLSQASGGVFIFLLAFVFPKKNLSVSDSVQVPIYDF